MRSTPASAPDPAPWIRRLDRPSHRPYRGRPFRLPGVLLAIAIVYAPVFGRVVRASVRAERHKESIDPVGLVGAREWRIIVRHLLSTVLSSIIVQAAVTLSHASPVELALSYLGLGMQPPKPSRGTMLSEGRALLGLAPRISPFLGAAIRLAVVACKLVGE